MKALFMVIVFAFVCTTVAIDACVYTRTTADFSLQESEFDYNEIENVIWTLRQHENEWKSDEIGNRIYLKPQSICLTDNKIYLMVDTISIPLNSIHCDQNGYYLCIDFWGLGWECCKCGLGNGPAFKTCQYCGKKRCF